MIITCPSCARRYLVDDASLGAKSRTVKCRACSYSWFYQVNEIDLNQKVQKSYSRFAVVNWAFFTLSIVLLITGFIVGKPHIVRIWPASNIIYNSLPFVSKENVSTNLQISHLTANASNNQVHVNGSLVSLDESAVTVPLLNIILEHNSSCSFSEKIKSAFDKLLKGNGSATCTINWVHELPQTKILPGESIKFETSFELDPQSFAFFSDNMANFSGQVVFISR